jgi:cyclophilin family peptidyl-prolyl cis-trans isomerase
MKAIREFLAQQKIDKANASWKTKMPKPPKVTFDPASDYFWQIETNKGPIRIRLMPDVAPMHVSSTIYLTEAGFYDGLTFHRVIPGFMAQGGCPVGSGSGSPGYKYDGEFSPKVSHDKPGLLSMANAGPGTDGSQFFITFGPTPDLDGKHTVFGEVVKGMEAVRELEKQGGPPPAGKTKEPLKMTKCTIAIEPKATAAPAAAAAPKKE